MKPPGQRAMCSDECGQSGPHSAAGGRAVPDQDDDGGRLGHGADHAAGADHTEEGEEGLLAARARTLPRESHCLLPVRRDTGTACQVLGAGNEEVREQGGKRTGGREVRRQGNKYEREQGCKGTGREGTEEAKEQIG